MAGYYPDVPGARLAYDIDGTRVYSNTQNNLNILASRPLNASEMQSLNDTNDLTYFAPWDMNGGYFDSLSLIFLFPVTTDIQGFYFRGGRGNGVFGKSAPTVQYSTDTTNGVDGTWIDLTTFNGSGYLTNTIPDSRSNIILSAVLGIKGLRFLYEVGYDHPPPSTVHLYGNPSSSANELQFWHPTSNVPLSGAALDFGDVLQNTTNTKTFRVKNISSSKTASSISLQIEALTDQTPISLTSQYSLSTDGTNFYSSVSLPDLTNGSISSTITLKRNTNINAVLGLHDLRIKALAIFS